MLFGVCGVGSAPLSPKLCLTSFKMERGCKLGEREGILASSHILHRVDTMVLAFPALRDLISLIKGELDP